jgi:hypothetical protein
MLLYSGRSFHLPYPDTAFYSVADALACGCLLAPNHNRRFIDQILISRCSFLIPILTVGVLPIAGTCGGGVVFALIKSLVLRPWINVGIELSIEKTVNSAPIIPNWKWIRTAGVMGLCIYL